MNIGEIVVLATTLAFSPIAIIAAVLILSTKKAKSNIWAMLGGWVLGILAIGLLSLTIFGKTSQSGGSNNFMDWLNLILGLLLIIMGIGKWRSVKKQGKNNGNKLAEAIDQLKPSMAFLFGLLLGGPNAKNAAAIISAANKIVAAQVNRWQALGYFGLFTLIASLGLILPMVIYFMMRKQAEQLLGGLKNWLTKYSNVILITILLALGIMFLLNGLQALT